MSELGYEKAVAWLNSLNLKKSPPIIPSEMTDKEFARLRFTWVSPEDEEAVMKELIKRGSVLKAGDEYDKYK